ncbi:hypothetical protein CI610_02269 [invertebrate metagenome]|uniref:RNase H type-1 domain-containing protein n=1 Tax=invertebrate metagenome TaxID=1711999 RepID=A0A2H9T6D4_9ZZZZ
MQEFSGIAYELGVPLAEEKTVGPSHILTFLGYELNTLELTIRIPVQKLEELKSLLMGLLGLGKTTLKHLQSVVGVLNFFSRAIPSARAFNRRFYDAMAGASKPSHHIRLSQGIKDDIRVWLTFLEFFNGCSYFPDSFWLSDSHLQLYTDSAGQSNLGCGAVLQAHWAFFQWPKAWGNSDVMRDLTFLELVPVLLAMMLWGPQLKNKKIVLNIDNQSLVTVLNKKSSKSKRVMELVRPLVLHAMMYNIQFKAIHIQGIHNSIADSISRLQWARFRQLAPWTDPKPADSPASFQMLISKLRLRN